MKTISPPISGVYKIVSRKNPHKIYIGASVNIRLRWNLHRSKMTNGFHSNWLIRNHVEKYGINDLKFKIIERCNREDVIYLEQYYITSTNPSLNNNNKSLVRNPTISISKAKSLYHEK